MPDDPVVLLGDGPKGGELPKDPPVDRYTFEVQRFRATGEILMVLPKGDDETPWGLSDKSGIFELTEQVLTLAEAEALARISKHAGGDGLTKDAKALLIENVAQLEDRPVTFAAASLARAKVVGG